jgi:hypothetical protein
MVTVSDDVQHGPQAVLVSEVMALPLIVPEALMPQVIDAQDKSQEHQKNNEPGDDRLTLPAGCSFQLYSTLTSANNTLSLTGRPALSKTDKRGRAGSPASYRPTSMT